MNNQRCRVASLIVAMSFLSIASACKIPEQAALTATISFAGKHSDEKLKTDLFGTNIQWEHSGDGILRSVGSEPQFHVDAIEMAKRLRVSSIRFPGGSLSDTYEWWNTVGPVDARAKGLSFSKELIASDFGTDELVALCRELDANAVLTVNFNWSNEQATNWVEYVNRSGAHSGAAIAVYWEIGNEIYSPNESGHTTATKYALRANEFAAAMKSADPNIKIGATVEASFLQAAWMGSIYPHMTTWNSEVIELLSTDIDFLSLHFYAPFDKLGNSSDLSRLVLAGPVVFRQNLEIIRNVLRKSDRANMEFAVTEYNTFFGDALKVDSRTATPESALFLALMLFEMSNHEDIVLANNWSLINNNVFGMFNVGRDGNAVARPAFSVFEALSSQKDNWKVEVSSHGPTYSVNAKGNIPSLEDVPYLSAMATENEHGTRFLNMVNSNPDSPISLEVQGLTSPVASAILQQWHGVSTGEWQRSYKTEEVEVDGTAFAIDLPPFSFTTIALRRN